MIVQSEAITKEQIEDIDELARAARREYDRQYRETHREQRRQWNRDFWARRGRELQRERRERNAAKEQTGGSDGA